MRRPLLLAHGRIRLPTRTVPIAHWFKGLMVTLGVLARYSLARLSLLLAGVRYGLLKPDSDSNPQHETPAFEPAFLCVQCARTGS